jgi:hypothetical protein
MTDLTLFVGLDVHKKTISVAMVEATAGAEVRFYGTISNTPDAIRGLCKKLTSSSCISATRQGRAVMACSVN